MSFSIFSKIKTALSARRDNLKFYAVFPVHSLEEQSAVISALSSPASPPPSPLAVFTSFKEASSFVKDYFFRQSAPHFSSWCALRSLDPSAPSSRRAYERQVLSSRTSSESEDELYLSVLELNYSRREVAQNLCSEWQQRSSVS